MSRWRQAAGALAARLGRARPIYAHYGVTHRCNMRCRMCVVWKDGNAREELALPQIVPLATELAQAGVRMVALGGGEPFVRRDLAGIVAAFHAAGTEVRVLTNGVALDDARIDEVVAAGLRHVSISLDSLDPAKEKDIYGGRDVWDDIVASMRRFRARLRTPPSIPILNVCVSRLNLDELPALVAFAVQEGFFCSFVPITLSPSDDRTDGFAAAAPDLAVRKEDHARLRAAYSALLDAKRRGAPIANSSRFLRDSVTFLETGTSRWTCDAGTLYVSVSPQGGVSICHRFPPVARFDTPGLARRLTSAAARREARRQRAGCPGCMRPCWAEVTHAVHDLRSSVEAMGLMRRAPAAAAPAPEAAS